MRHRVASHFLAARSNRKNAIELVNSQSQRHLLNPATSKLERQAIEEAMISTTWIDVKVHDISLNPKNSPPISRIIVLGNMTVRRSFFRNSNVPGPEASA